ncbi:MAG: mechanosensitive ion channel family protein [Candidatus Sumerlaeia bacterium]|nr:mechanosensitive ion channel family protein [Candidatus Sumerlaeia bacterium]
MEDAVEFVQHVGENRVVSTVILMVVLFLLRAVVHARLRDWEGLEAADRRRWMTSTRNGIMALLIVGLMLIWAEQLRTFALSVFAITAAIVVATKELILCISGSVLRTAAGSFKVGDRIEVNNMRGDVIDMRLMSTTILEIGPGTTSHQHTGRAIVIPNSLFVSASVINETYTQDYVLHIFSVPVGVDKGWKEAEEILLDAAQAECAPYMDQARRHMDSLQRRHGLEKRNIEPRVVLQMPDPTRVNLLVRIPVPARQKGRVEQEIVRRYLDERARREAAAKAAAVPDSPPPAS